MRSLLLTAILLLCNCSAEQPTPVAQRHRTVVPDYSLDAFGGHLVGTDRGEWIGELMFQDAEGNLDTVLKENVVGIVRNNDGVFAFTGLAHLGTDEGYIYVISPARKGVVASRLERLPGAPSQVSQPHPGDATSFLVYSGFSNDRPLFECYQLVGKLVTRGYDCSPPKN